MEKPFVLLADDSEATCTLIKALLRTDFVVETASDGAEAVEKLKGRQYAAILLDLLMPLVDGYAVLDFLKQERPELLQRVLVLTAAVSRREMQHVGNYEVRAIIAKPFDVDNLMAAVHECARQGGPSFIGGPLVTGGIMLMLAAEMLRRV